MKTIRFIFCMIGLALSATTVRGQSASHWSCDIHAYRYDMTVYVQLKSQGKVLSDYSDYELAAFCGDECRGVGTVLTATTSGGETVVLVRIRARSKSYSGDEMHLRVYQKSANTETAFPADGFTFKSVTVLGTPSAPVLLTIGAALTGDVNGDGTVNISDVTALVNVILGKGTGADGNDDVNGDGTVNISDVTALVNIILGK